MKHVNITITGKVQGVFFRASTKAVADQMGVRGFVCNHADGSVYVEAEGAEVFIDEIISWCKEGPDGANVENVEITSGTMKNYRNFEIIKNK